MRISTSKRIYWKLLRKYRTPLIGMLDKTYYAIPYTYLALYARKTNSLLKYVPALGDCDNFAFVYKGIADRECNAVGIIYGTYKGVPHCWNIAFTEEEGLIQVEPQSELKGARLEGYKPIVIVI